MRVTTEQLQAHLVRDIKPLYAVYGEETLLALEAADRIRAAARAHGYIEREILTADAGFRWSELELAASSQSLFSSRKLLELRIPGGKPGIEGSSALQRFCERAPVDTVTLVQLPGVDWRSQKSSWFEALEAAGLMVEARPVSRRSLPQWIAGRLKEQNQTADVETLSFIAERVEGNLMAAHQEIQKLALLFAPGPIGFDDVRHAVLDVARYDVFDLGEVMIEGDPARLSRVLDGLRGEGVAPPLVLWTLSEEIRALGKIATGSAAGKPIAMLMREARIRGLSHQNTVQANYARYSLSQITDALRHAATIDRMIKGLCKGDVWDEILQLGLRFAKSGATPARPPRSARRTATPTRPTLL